jgi:hypothetical protein
MDTGEKASAVIQTRLDYTTIASLARWLIEKQKVYIASRSDLVYKITETLARSLEMAGEIERFPSLWEAKQFMDKYNMGNLTVGSKSKSIFGRAMGEEALAAEGQIEYAMHSVRSKRQNSKVIREASDAEMRAMCQEAIDKIKRDGPQDVDMEDPEDKLRKALGLPPAGQPVSEAAARVYVSDDSAPISSEAFAQREAEVLAQLKDSFAAPMAQAPTLKEEE